MGPTNIKYKETMLSCLVQMTEEGDYLEIKDLKAVSVQVKPWIWHSICYPSFCYLPQQHLPKQWVRFSTM